MGCDIHIFIEGRARNVRNSQWELIKELRVNFRNYSYFAWLAGVRGDGPQIPGLWTGLDEEETSLGVQFAGPDHTLGYMDPLDFLMTTRKFLEQQEKDNVQPAEYIQHLVYDVESHLEYLAKYVAKKDGPLDARMVIFFDS